MFLLYPQSSSTYASESSAPTGSPAMTPAVYVRQEEPYYVTLTIARPSSTEYKTVLLGTKTNYVPQQPNTAVQQPSPAPAAAAAGGGGSSGGSDSLQTAAIVLGVLFGLITIASLWCVFFRQPHDQGLAADQEVAQESAAPLVRTDRMA